MDERYGNKGKLVSIIMDEVINLNSMCSSDAAYSLQMIKTVEKAQRDLIRVQAEEELFNVQTILTIEKRMTDPMRQEWAKELVGTQLTSKDKFKMLIDHLKNWRSRLEYLADEVRTPVRTGIQGNSHHIGGNDNRRYHSQQDMQQTKRPPTCWMR